jgi:hypothetical protein
MVQFFMFWSLSYKILSVNRVGPFFLCTRAPLRSYSMIFSCYAVLFIIFKPFVQSYFFICHNSKVNITVVEYNTQKVKWEYCKKYIKLAGSNLLARARYGPPARFRPIWAFGQSWVGQLRFSAIRSSANRSKHNKISN